MNKHLNINEQGAGLSRKILTLISIGAGLVVANNYYNQPLLGKIAQEFAISESTAYNISMLTQIGYACGLLFLIPLGDMFYRRKIILWDFLFIILSLLTFALSSNITIIMISSFCIGFTSVVPQMFVPIAAALSTPQKRAQNISMVISGLLVGILLSRVFSGMLGEYLGWREVYYIASGMMFILMICIYFMLPDLRPSFSGTYQELMKSLGFYFRTVPTVRIAAIRAGFAFGSFSSFWITLTFLLHGEPFNAGSDIAGQLGLIGMAGALMASVAGRLTNKISKSTLIFSGFLLMLAAWGIFGIWGMTYIGLIVGILLLDIGLQGANIVNQTLVFSSHPEASNRLNTIYMVCYFIGGSLGTFLSGKAWENFGWMGSVTVGALLIIFAMATLLFRPKQA